MLSQILNKFNLSYEDLSTAEKDTLNAWMQSLSKKEVTLEKVKDFAGQLSANLARELADIPAPGSLSYFLYRHYWKKKDIYMRARLKNYIMLHDFLTGPDKARKWIEEQISQIK